MGGTAVSPDKLTPSPENVIGAAAAAPPPFDATGNEYARMRIMYLPQYDVKEGGGGGGGGGPPPYDTADGRYGMPATVVDHIYESPDCLSGRSPDCRRVYAMRIGQPPPPPPPLPLPASSADRDGGLSCVAARAEPGAAAVVPGGRHRMDAATEGGSGTNSSCPQKHGCANNCRTTGNYSL